MVLSFGELTIKKKKIQPKVEKVYSLDETIAAIESLANREAKGKVAIQIKNG